MEAQEIGSHIGQYRIVRKIGVGGMGTVFVGEHILLKRRAAIKTLLPLLSAKPEIVERFFREARATSAINDPGVVQIYDFGYHVDGTAYIVMELLEGESLSARLDRLGRLPPAEALRVARQVAGALAAAHAAGVVHRDLKPENIFLTRDAEAQGGERAKLLDFGICKLEGDDLSKTQSGVMLGTPVYMSPEQCQGKSDIDGRADVYSLGCVLFQMLTGRVPFDHEGHGDLIVAHLQHEPQAPSELVPDLSPFIDEIVIHSLAKDPEDRFQTPQAVQHAIDSILPQLTPAPITAGPSAVPLAPGFKSEFDGNGVA
jgi:eukaryotic-like serine/threonine-protein kinase